MAKTSLALASVLLASSACGSGTVTPQPRPELVGENNRASKPKASTAPASPASPAAPTEPTPPARPAPPQTPPVHDTKQWACTNDNDCVQTCALGAVSANWLEANRDADDCDDGCSWKGTNVACRDGACATLADDGTIDSDCTKRPHVPRAR